MDTARVHSSAHDRVHGRVHAVYLAVYTAPVHGGVTDGRVHGRVHVYTGRTRPCNGRVHDREDGRVSHRPVLRRVYAAVYMARTRP